MIVYEIRHFTPREFRCRCCGRLGAVPALAALLDWTRRAWGGPVVVNSGFRCAAHNAAVGGAAKSRHLLGLAADVRPLDGALLPAFKALVRSLTAGVEGMEVIDYPAFVHVAVPRSCAGPAWDGGKVKLMV